MLAFPAHGRAIVKRDRGGAAFGSALATICWVVDAIEHGLDVKFVTLLGSNLHILTQSTAMSAGAAAVGTQLFAPDQYRADLLGGFDGHGHHSAGKSGGVHSIQTGSCTRSAGVEGQNLCAPGMRRGGRIAAGAQRDLEIAQAPRALRRHPPGQQLIQSRIDRVGHHMANDMAQRHRGGMQGIHDGVVRRRDFKGRQTGRVIGNLWGYGAFERVAGIGFGVDQWAVDALLIQARSAGKIA